MILTQPQRGAVPLVAEPLLGLVTTGNEYLRRAKYERIGGTGMLGPIVATPIPHQGGPLGPGSWPRSTESGSAR
jgi:hypothetical protein